MRSEYISELLSQPVPPLAAEDDRATDALPAEVNVIHTNPRGTATALEFAARMARNLGVCIRIRAMVSVPLQLPMDQSLISVQFMEQLLCDLAHDFGAGINEKTVQVHLCRDRIEALLRLLKPHSLVIVAGRKRWWPTPASRLAQALRDNGHDVVFIRVERRLAGVAA
jgi:hypothetical protein